MSILVQGGRGIKPTTPKHCIDENFECGAFKFKNGYDVEVSTNLGKLRVLGDTWIRRHFNKVIGIGDKSWRTVEDDGLTTKRFDKLNPQVDSNVITYNIELPEGTRLVKDKDGKCRVQPANGIQVGGRHGTLLPPVINDGDGSYHLDVYTNGLEVEYKITIDKTWFDGQEEVIVDPDITIDTTAEFGAGTANDPADGNFGIDCAVGTGTVGGNPAVTANQIVLANILGDDFTKADADSLTYKWALETGGDSGTRITDIDTTVNDMLYLYGKYEGAIEANIRRKNSIDSNLTSSSTFDIRLYVNSLVKFDANSYFELTALVDSSNYIQLVRRVSTNDWGSRIKADSSDTGNVYAAGNISEFYMRLYYDGTTYYAQYSTDNSSWVTVNSLVETMIGSARIYFRLNTYTNNNAEQEMYVGWFRVYDGTFTGTPYRTSGNWTDQLESITHRKRVKNIGTSFSGLSATETVQLDLLDKDGTTVHTGTAQTSGSTRVETPLNDHIDWEAPSTAQVKAKASLAGDGTTTPAVTQVDYTFDWARPKIAGAEPILDHCFVDSPFL